MIIYFIFFIIGIAIGSITSYFTMKKKSSDWKDRYLTLVRYTERD